MDTVHPVIGNVRTLRRSQRLRIAEEVVVAARRGNGKSSTETTKTLIVSANGTTKASTVRTSAHDGRLRTVWTTRFRSLVALDHTDSVAGVSATLVLGLFRPS